MHEPVIVLITEWKKEKVEKATVKLFPNKTWARRHCALVNTGSEKYWSFAQIVEDGSTIDLCQPQEKQT